MKKLFFILIAAVALVSCEKEKELDYLSIGGKIYQRKLSSAGNFVEYAAFGFSDKRQTVERWILYEYYEDNKIIQVDTGHVGTYKYDFDYPKLCIHESERIVECMFNNENSFVYDGLDTYTLR